MLKEVKYLIFLLIISFYFFYSKYYFSDSYKKKSYRSLASINEKIETYSQELPILEDDTQNILLNM
jgi:hypothetical protein